MYNLYNFTGRFLNRNIVSTQAESPSNLYELLKSDEDPPIVDLRCWLLLETEDGNVWAETLLNVPRYFEVQKSLFDEDIRIEFRHKTQHSPNSSQKAKGGEVYDEDRELSLAITTTMSSLEMNDGSWASTPRSSSSGRDYIDYSSAMIEVDPISLENVTELSQPFVLRFVGGEFLCLELTYFEKFITTELEKGANLINLKLKNVLCKDKTERTFVLTKNVWFRSVLHCSQLLRNTFCKYLEWSIEREDQLLTLQNDKDLSKRVLFWVSEFLDFRVSEHRLNEPPEEGAPPFMTPFYFSTEETQILCDLRMPNHVVLREQLALMMGGKEHVCASHDIFPILVVAFDIKKDFQKSQRFKNDKKKWIKEREKEIKKNKK